MIHQTIRTTVDENWVEVEESGRLKMIRLTDDESDPDDGLFIQFMSWNENKDHSEFEKFVGKTVRITIETID